MIRVISVIRMIRAIRVIRMIRAIRSTTCREHKFSARGMEGHIGRAYVGVVCVRVCARLRKFARTQHHIPSSASDVVSSMEMKPFTFFRFFLINLVS